MQVTIVGMGPGAFRMVPEEIKTVLQEAELLIGAQRLLKRSGNNRAAASNGCHIGRRDCRVAVQKQRRRKCLYFGQWR